MANLRAYVNYDFSRDSYDLHLAMDAPSMGGQGGSFRAKPMEFTKIDRGLTGWPEPFLGCSRKDADDGIAPTVDNFLQAMMDAAWDRGLRPKGFKDHTNELSAVRYHLEDMRGLTFKTGKP